MVPRCMDAEHKSRPATSTCQNNDDVLFCREREGKRKLKQEQAGLAVKKLPKKGGTKKKTGTSFGATGVFQVNPKVGSGGGGGGGGKGGKGWGGKGGGKGGGRR